MCVCVSLCECVSKYTWWGRSWGTQECHAPALDGQPAVPVPALEVGDRALFWGPLVLMRGMALMWVLSLPSPVLACLTPHPLSMHRCGHFNLPSGTDCSPYPAWDPTHSTWIHPFLGTHHSASSLLLPPHLLLSQPRSHAGHTPILCSISEWAFRACTPKPAP